MSIAPVVRLRPSRDPLAEEIQMAERSEIIGELRLLRAEIVKVDERVRALELELAGGRAVKATLARGVGLAASAGAGGVALAKLLGLIGL